MYRGAARGWQQALTTHLERICVLQLDTQSICTPVHGVDYMSPGTRSGLDWLEARLNKRLKAKTQRLRNQSGMGDINTFNRISRPGHGRGLRA